MTSMTGTTGWGQIIAAIGIALGGEPERGRHMMLACWNATAESDFAQRCVLAHYLADTEAVLDDEVSWDERALAAFAHVGKDDLAAIGIPDAAGLAPSLHLNLGDGYLRQHRPAEARVQLDAGLAAAGVLGADGYGTLIRDGLERLAGRIADVRQAQ
ncbi:hypothetical protein [Kineosporia sp. NBRC 101731]|uniref:hypothetical protein n=1 Tax=Kineosporia sp. NBRC 101731 TaxID=3032199 RepID=UPI002555E694|nr:hypothetical protein [Kineosporia sp. NBRC 101731]